MCVNDGNRCCTVLRSYVQRELKLGQVDDERWKTVNETIGLFKVAASVNANSLELDVQNFTQMPRAAAQLRVMHHKVSSSI